MRARSCSPSQRCSSLKPDEREIEGGELVGAVADDRDPLGFEEFERLPDIEDRLRAGAHDRDAGARKLDQIGGNVERLLGAAMHAADAAGGEDFDAREPGDKHRRRDRRARRALARRDQRQIAPRGLHHAAAELAEPLDLLARKAHSQAPVDDRDRRGNGPHLAHRLLDGSRRLDVARVGHAMRDDRRFERDDRPFGRARLGDLGGKVQKIGGAHRSSLSSRTAAISRAEFIGNLHSDDQWRGSRCASKTNPAPRTLAVRRILATFAPKAQTQSQSMDDKPRACSGPAGPRSLDPAGAGRERRARRGDRGFARARNRPSDRRSKARWSRSSTRRRMASTCSIWR